MYCENDITKRLSLRMKEKGKSQREVARAIGVPEQRLSDKRHGRYGYTTKDISALADFFGVSTDYLLGRIDTLRPVVGVGTDSTGADGEV